MKGAFPFAEAPSHRVLPGETEPRPDAWGQAKAASIPMFEPELLSEEAMDALCMQAIEAATDWRVLAGCSARRSDRH